MIKVNSLRPNGAYMQICVSELTIIGSDNGLSPGHRQAIIWTNDAILLIQTFRIHFSEIVENFIHFHSRQCISKCQENGGHLVSASVIILMLPIWMQECFHINLKYPRILQDFNVHFEWCHLVHKCDKKLLIASKTWKKMSTPFHWILCLLVAWHHGHFILIYNAFLFSVVTAVLFPHKGSWWTDEYKYSNVCDSDVASQATTNLLH